jgi:putative transposase
MLPKEYPPWPTVHYYYRRWRLDGTWERIHTQVRQQVRQALGRQTTPSGAVLDSQSIKTTEKGGLLVQAPSAMTATRRSRDASVICWWTHKDWCSKSKPQAHIWLNAMEHANCWSMPTAGACQLLEPVSSQLPRLQIVWADQGYSGEFQSWMQERLGWR